MAATSVRTELDYSLMIGIAAVVERDGGNGLSDNAAAREDEGRWRRQRPLSDLWSLVCIFLWSGQIWGRRLLTDCLDGLDRSFTVLPWQVHPIFGSKAAVTEEDVDVEDGLRSKRICAPCLVTELLGGLDWPCRCRWGRRLCCYRDDEDAVSVGLNSLDLEGVNIIVVLSSSDRPIAAAGGGRRTAAMAAITGGGNGGDGAPNSGALTVHEL
ncbi:hypothetical protein ACLOJK_035310 [Asimina triloba]